MSDSWSGAKRIPRQEIEERMETVRELSADGTDTYQVVKDRETGDHYLLYRLIHRSIAEGGQAEETTYLLPLESDDVLSLMFGDQPYAYPEHWTRPYLRPSGEGEAYVWFDPSEFAEHEHYEEVGRKLVDRIAEFKRAGNLDEAAVKKLMDELDSLK